MSIVRPPTSSVLCLAVIAALASCAGCDRGGSKSLRERAGPQITFDPPPEVTGSAVYVARPQRSLTFTKDIAPIVFEKCAGCHRPGEIGPFPLVSYADVNKRARQIVEVTQQRIMPPWSPLPGYCQFERDRSLDVDELGIIAQWVEEGAQEGHSAEIPQLPDSPSEWKFGMPDCVVKMPEPFVVPAETSTDIYRKFVIRVPIEETKYVRAFDFHPGNERVVHHMRLRADRSGLSRAQDDHDPLPGFDGAMYSGDTEPDRFFLIWTPGYEALPKRADVAWSLHKGTDLVLELHLHPTGKEEQVQSSIALYFQPTPPRETLYAIQLSCETIDIAPGVNDARFEDRYVLPIDTTILTVMPHAHYLGTQIRSWAVLPDGQKIWLMRIADWDFNWQREYTYAEPISLPKGTTLCMEVTYDNSADNPQNPHNPPQRVVVGPDTFNEMAQVFFQVLATHPGEGELLLADYSRKDFENDVLRERFLIERGFGTSEVHFNLACRYGLMGDVPQALLHYQKAIRLKPDNVFAINNLGGLYRQIGRPDDAIQQFSRALDINPRDARVHNNLGLVHLFQGRMDDAAQHFRQATRFGPELGEPWMNLGIVALHQQNLELAKSYFIRALEANPDLEAAQANLRKVQAQLAGSR